MGQAQSQSSSNEYDEGHGHDYQVYQRPEDYSQPGHIPNVYRQNFNQVGSNTNSQLSNLQHEGSNQGSRQAPSINEQYPNTYPNLGTKKRLPNKQDQKYGSSFDEQRPSLYQGLETNNRMPGEQDHRYKIGTFFDKQYPNAYPSLAMNKKMLHKQDQEFSTGTFIRQTPPTHPSLESNYESFIRNLPSLCNFLYQTCLNSLTYNNRFNQFKIIPNLQNVASLSQNNERNQNGENQFKGTKVTNDRNFGFPLYGDEIHPNQMDQTYRGSSRSGESGYQHPSYVPSSRHVNLNQIYPINQQSQGALSTRGYNVQQHSYTPSNENMNPSQLHFSHGQFQGSYLTTERPNSEHLRYSSYGRNINSNQIQPTYGQYQNALNTGGSYVKQRLISTREPNFPQSSNAPFSGNRNLNQLQSAYYIQPYDSLSTQRSDTQQPDYTPYGENLNLNQIQPSYEQSQGLLGTGESNVQQPSYASSGENINPNQAQSIYDWDQNYFGVGRSNTQQPSYEQSLGSFGIRRSNVQQPSYISSGNISPYQIQLTNPQSLQGPSGTKESNTQNPSYALSNGNINKLQTSYGQYQIPPSTGESNAQLTSYTPLNRDVFQNGPSFQLTSDMKKVPGNYSSMYTDDYYNGGQLGSQIGNKYSSPYPVVGGQFGSDISTGGSITPINTEGGDAQSMTNVTSTLVSSQGKSKSEMTQTQVSGSYSAQAQTSATDKGALGQIESNTNGTISTAHGKSGEGQAQSHIVYNSESSVALGEATPEINYVTNTQLQAGIKGGMANAESTGPGNTSSQAHIGFLPYESNINTEQKLLFKGSEIASSQSGSYSDQTKSQQFGSYKHKISYNGAAQASSDKKLQDLPKLNAADAKLKIEQLEGSDIAVKQKFNTLPPQLSINDLLRSQTSPKNIIIGSKEQNITKITTTNPIILRQEPSQNLDIDSEYKDNEEYDDESDDDLNTKSAATKTDPLKQEQNIILNLDDKHDAQITRDSDGGLKHGQVFDVGEIIPGTNRTKVPDGFRGKVASVAGDHIKDKTVPGGQAQTQTVLLTPGTGGLTMINKTKVRTLLDQESYVRPTIRTFNNFQTDLNGETGKYKSDDVKNVQYFTKSSTCGYFSFSCNFVNGAKSGPKICKPNPPPFPCQKSN